MNKLFIGSNNKAKIGDYKIYFKNLQIVSAADLNISLDIPENDISLKENSENKARTWAKASGLTTLSDDTGFFIPALDGKPGVSVKKWGGEFKAELTNQEFIKVLKQKLENIDDTSCYFETCFSIANPQGEVRSFSLKNFGTIDKNLFHQAYMQGFPLSAVFKATGRIKTWAEMSEAEKIHSDKELIENVNKILNSFDMKT